MAADAATADSEKPASLVGYALSVLTTNSHIEKARLTREALDRWRTGLLPAFLPEDEATPPARPARDPSIQICDPGAFPDNHFLHAKPRAQHPTQRRRPPARLHPSGLAPKRGRGGTLTSRVALLHSLAHIESWAVDLSWDIIARFGRAEQMPRQFFDDWAIVAEDEARHFEALAMRLEEVGSRYGALPAHDGLWESATATAHSLAARLAVEHCTHEARTGPERRPALRPHAAVRRVPALCAARALVCVRALLSPLPHLWRAGSRREGSTSSHRRSAASAQARAGPSRTVKP